MMRKIFGLVSLVLAGVIVTWMYTGDAVDQREQHIAATEVQGEMLDAPAAPSPSDPNATTSASSTPPLTPPPNLDPSDPASEWKIRPVGKGGNILVTLEELGSYPYEPPIYPDPPAAQTATDDTATTPRIPLKFQALNGMKIATYGYMIPIDLDKNEIREFILVNNLLACCFGVMPDMNQWLHVTLAKGKTEYVPNVPVLVVGTMDVGERWENDMVISLYRMKAESVRPMNQ